MDHIIRSILDSSTNGIATLNIGTGSTAGSLSVWRVWGRYDTPSNVNFNHSGKVTFAPLLTDSLIINKRGTGTTTFTGANTYTGGTFIHAGTLLVNNTTGSGTGSGEVTVNSGGTLGGLGAISGQVLVNNGGTLSPGNSPGRLNLNSSLMLSAGATLSIELGGNVAGSGYDQMMVGGALTLSGSTLSRLINQRLRACSKPEILHYR